MENKDRSQVNELFRQRVQRFGDTVFRVAFNRLRNYSDAEDIAQEVFLALYKCGKDFESDEHLKSWLIRTTINKCVDLKRSFWFLRTEPISESMAYTLDEMDKSILSEIQKLSPVYRDVIYLYYYEGYQIGEIASITGVSVNTASSRLKRARKKLGLILEGVKTV
jgi:RNA polymerase sigma-70 factor (ECF subfamily)